MSAETLSELPWAGLIGMAVFGFVVVHFLLRGLDEKKARKEEAQAEESIRQKDN